MKYSDLLADWLTEEGYTHCFAVAGGNIMHLMESISRRLVCVPVVHEVAAGIAAEYFNATAPNGQRALALVTAGPGLTNIVTAFAGAYLESRELLVMGGQVKTSDLSRGKLRQRGIQEVNGVEIVRSLCTASYLMDEPLSQEQFRSLCRISRQGRPGPVFIEIPLDIQGLDLPADCSGTIRSVPTGITLSLADESAVRGCVALFNSASRPAVLIGGGVSRAAAKLIADFSASLKLPLFTTWNGIDRLAADHPCYFGRPNTWGMRYSNLLLQQADFILALGTRLGLQQTGFNWSRFGPLARVVQVDGDADELKKGHPRLDLGICAEANDFIIRLMPQIRGNWKSWHDYCKMVQSRLPLIEQNETHDGFICPYRFVELLSTLAGLDDVVIPCSSGAAYTVMMQTFAQQAGQKIVTNKGLASMGYGLSGAIGAALANSNKRTILMEGDGGFAQNLQELGTVAVNKLNLKIFLFINNGYASIRMTQSNYFKGHYVGCDQQSGLGLPDWPQLFKAYGITTALIEPGFERNSTILNLFKNSGPAAFLVNIDPLQTYFPKITSRVTPTGMESNSLDHMSPDLPDDLFKIVGKYLLPNSS